VAAGSAPSLPFLPAGGAPTGLDRATGRFLGPRSPSRRPRAAERRERRCDSPPGWHPRHDGTRHVSRPGRTPNQRAVACVVAAGGGPPASADVSGGLSPPGGSIASAGVSGGLRPPGRIFASFASRRDLRFASTSGALGRWRMPTGGLRPRLTPCRPPGRRARGSQLADGSAGAMPPGLSQARSRAFARGAPGA